MRESAWAAFDEGKITDGCVVCPWHGMEFNVTTGRCLARKRGRLRQFRVTVEDNQVKVTV